MDAIKPKLLPKTISVIQGSSVEFIVQDLQPAPNDVGAWWISKVDADRTYFMMASANPFSAVDSQSIVICESTKDLAPGLYLLAKFALQEQSSAGPTQPQSIPLGDTPILFKIVSSSDQIQTATELLTEYKAILAKRDADFHRGFGYEPTAPGVREYIALVFVRDCLLTTQVRLGRYQAIPFEGLGFNDQMQLIQSVLAASDLPPLENLEETLEHAKRGQPTFVVHFPHVFAPSVEAAGELVESEVQRLVDVLALQRNGYGSILGTVLLEASTLQSWFRVALPHYRGNLIGGEFSGEDPQTIVAHVTKLRRDLRLQLYLSLFREALREERAEVTYFRFWNILETIARSKGYIGQPLRDWGGNVIKNRRGQLRHIRDDAKELVFELLRLVFIKHGFDQNSLASGLRQGSISDLVPIWYRHRNCMVHCGGCFPDDPNHCLRTDAKYTNCKAAHDEIMAQFGVRDGFTDQYLSALRETVGIVIRSELV